MTDVCRLRGHCRAFWAISGPLAGLGGWARRKAGQARPAGYSRVVRRPSRTCR